MHAVTGSEFTTVFGRGLVGEMSDVAHRPYLVVTMDDLWPAFEGQLAEHLAGVYRVSTLDLGQLEADATTLPPHRSIIGLGGGQASDVAKFFSLEPWRAVVPGADRDDDERALLTSSAVAGRRQGGRDRLCRAGGGLCRLRRDP